MDLYFFHIHEDTTKLKNFSFTEIFYRKYYYFLTLHVKLYSQYDTEENNAKSFLLLSLTLCDMRLNRGHLSKVEILAQA